MALYFVNYDLRKQRNYQDLYAALNGIGAKRILESVWALTHNNSSCAVIRDHLRQHIDADDGLVVSQVSDWASYKSLAVIPNV